MEKLLKNVDEKSWQEFRTEAARHKKKLGDFFTDLIREHKRAEKKGDLSWEHVLEGKRRITDEEATAIKEVHEEMKKEYGFER